MEHTQREENGHTIVAFTGDIDLESSPEVRRVLLDCVKHNSSVIVDLSGVDYIDSSGVASMVEAFQTTRAGNCHFSLAAVSESALRVLQLARLDKVFTIYGTVEEGLADGG